jgi:hypothetical protein
VDGVFLQSIGNEDPAHFRQEFGILLLLFLPGRRALPGFSREKGWGAL